MGYSDSDFHGVFDEYISEGNADSGWKNVEEATKICSENCGKSGDVGEPTSYDMQGEALR